MTRSSESTARSAAARPRFTLDSNLLVYSVDLDAGARHEAAFSIVDKAPDADCWLTLQSLSEFYAAVTRKRIMPPVAAAAQVEDWLAFFRSVAVTASAIRTALANAVAGRASYWDALLVATAAESGCTLILTEDMADGRRLGAVEIHNPFTRSGGLTARTRRLLEL
jgi:predicted nucleic acid-binding protein